MKHPRQLLKSLESLGFRLLWGGGSRVKIVPPDKTQPIYSCHEGEEMLHPLRRFAAKNWNLDITTL